MKDKRTYADRAKYIAQAVAKRRKKIRNMAIEYMGGKCSVCGYKRCKEALEFHHLDEKNKKFGLSQSGLTRSWARTKSELKKCILICANCHRELHSNTRSLSKKFESEK